MNTLPREIMKGYSIEANRALVFLVFFEVMKISYGFTTLS